MKREPENRQKFPFDIEIMTGTTTASIRRKQLFQHFIHFLYLYWEPNIGEKNKKKIPRKIQLQREAEKKQQLR